MPSNTPRGARPLANPIRDVFVVSRTERPEMIETLAHVTTFEFPTLLLAFVAGLAAGVAGTLAATVARRR